MIDIQPLLDAVSQGDGKMDVHTGTILMLEAIKELQKEVDALKHRLLNLENSRVWVD